ncbi:MAG: hypothetical protein AAFR61_09440 [Bacteroidota bacterium]
MNKLSLILITLSMSLGNLLHGQGDPYFMLEIGGWAPFYSVNYLKPLTGNDKIAAFLRMGGSIGPEHIGLPLGIMIHNKVSPHQWQAGGGVVIYSEGIRAWDRNQSDIKGRLVFDVGYRYQPAKKAYFFGLIATFFGVADPSPGDWFEFERRGYLGAGLQIGTKI